MDVSSKKFKNSSPKMCGFYSITSDREYDETASSLRYLKLPTDLPIDLNKGIDTIKYKTESYLDEKMDSILKYILKNKTDFVCYEKGSALIPSTKYITYRGVLKLVMLSLYEKRNGWSVLATKYKNNIYMCQLTKPERRDAFNNTPFSRMRFCYYGPKFKQCCTSEDPSKMPDTSKQIDANSQFFGIFKRMLVGRDFIFAGEMDAIESDTPVDLNKRDELNNIKFVGLKICEDFSTNWFLPAMFRMKIETVWTQSFLTGVQDNYFGMRDKEGIVKRIVDFTTDALHRRVKNHFEPSICFGFLDEFLKLVEEKMQNIDCPDTVFEFDFNHVNEEITCKLHKGKTDFSLLPDWYLDAVNP